MYNTPLVPYTSFNNTVVLGSVVGWLGLAGFLMLQVMWMLTAAFQFAEALIQAGKKSEAYFDQESKKLEPRVRRNRKSASGRCYGLARPAFCRRRPPFRGRSTSWPRSR